MTALKIIWNKYLNKALSLREEAINWFWKIYSFFFLRNYKVDSATEEMYTKNKIWFTNRKSLYWNGGNDGKDLFRAGGGDYSGTQA